MSAEFVSRQDALHKLESLPWPVMRDPLQAYLRKDVGCGQVWLYREQNGLQTRVAPTPAPEPFRIEFPLTPLAVHGILDVLCA